MAGVKQLIFGGPKVDTRKQEQLQARQLALANKQQRQLDEREREDEDADARKRRAGAARLTGRRLLAFQGNETGVQETVG